LKGLVKIRAEGELGERMALQSGSR
jgi:hypothetical protein